MTVSLKLLTALSLIALTAGCVAGGNNRVDTPFEVEQTLDSDIDGDGMINGEIPVGAEE